jgi:hypothetical protein
MRTAPPPLAFPAALLPIAGLLLTDCSLCRAPPPLPFQHPPTAGLLQAGGLALPERDASSDILITQINLANTLLSDAVETVRARFISDCAKYLQVGGA